MRCQKLWVYCHLAAITVDFLYGDAASQVFFETTVEGDTLPNVVDHWEELEEGGERWTAVFRHAHLKKLEVMTCRVSLRYLHLASVDELQEPGGILDGDVRQEQHLVAPVLLLEQPLQRLDIKLELLFTSRSCSPGGTWRRRQQRSSERAGRRSHGRWGSGHSSWESKD